MKKPAPLDVRKALDEADPRPVNTAERTEKKNYAERFSRALATLVASGLRRHKRFRSILPGEDGSRQESRVRSSRGIKKLDVNFSSPEMGLGLGISIKTINFRDASQRTGKLLRYTKNYSRNDNELRAEAVDYHRRQPYAVLVAVVFLPADSCDDTVRDGASSFGAAVKYFRPRAGRRNPKNEEDRFERVYIGLYEHEGPVRGHCSFFDVCNDPPRAGRPSSPPAMDLREMLDRVRAAYDERNAPPFKWAEKD